MKIYIKKIEDYYRVFAPELEPIAIKVGYDYENLIAEECDADGAIEIFRDELQAFIEYYFNEANADPEDWPDYLVHEYIFNKTSFKNCYLSDPIIYEKRRGTTHKSLSKVFMKKAYVIIETFPLFESFKADKKAKEKGASTQLMLNKKTEFAIVGPKPVPQKIMDKINNLNENGANIQIIPLSEI